MTSNLTVKIGADIQDLRNEINKATSTLRSFSSDVTKLFGQVGIALGVKEAAAFTLELGKVAGQAKGVKDAFDRLPNATALMNQLKAATGDTVSELDLMKRAVQAKNFDISLQALPKLLQFATVRAQQTGQSIDYLVDSIVTGIGRKSKLILDNLGISAVQLNEKLRGVGIGEASVAQVANAVGEIAAESLSKAGQLADNTSTKVQRLGASWENLKVTLGNIVNDAGLPNWIDSVNEGLNEMNSGLKLGTSLRALQNEIDAFNIGVRTGAIAGKDFIDKYDDIGAQAKTLGIKLIALKDSATGTFKILFDPRTTPNWVEATDDKSKSLTETLASLQEKLKSLNQTFEETDLTDKKKLANIGAEILSTKQQIAVLEKLRAAQKDKNEGKQASFFDLGAGTQFGKGTKTGADFLSSLGLDPKSIDAKLQEALKVISTFGLTVRQEIQKTIDLTPVLNNALAGIGQALGSAISGSQNLGQGLLAALGGVLTQLGEMLITAGFGVEAFKTSLESLNGYVAIAAGIALVAIGSAVSGSIRGLGSKASVGGGYSGSSTNYSGGSGGSFNSSGLEVKVAGEVRIAGDDLIYILNRANQKNGRTRLS